MADRFEIAYSQRSWNLDAQIMVDTFTGVNYLVLKNGTHVDAVTPLLDQEGKVIVTPAKET